MMVDGGLGWGVRYDLDMNWLGQVYRLTGLEVGVRRG